MKTIKISLKILLFFTVVTGIAYPLFVTFIAQLVFNEKANGSLLVKNNQIIGSELIGQKFDSVIYFSSRPSAISYSPLPSGGSNYGLTSLKLKTLVDERKQHFISFNQIDTLAAIPSEMLFCSASGLDPHISQKAAILQADRVANARNLNSTQKQILVQSVIDLTETKQLLVLGEERVNVLLLNLELDRLVQSLNNKKN